MSREAWRMSSSDDSLARRRLTSFVAMESIESNSIAIFTNNSPIFAVNEI
jgi:hypothetical protein